MTSTPCPRVGLALRALALLALAAAPLSAGQILVPTDFADLQAAIDAASPGDVIVIDGGTHGPVTVDKAITLAGVAGNRPFIRTPDPGDPQLGAAILLAGPGSGTAVISTLDIDGEIAGNIFGSPNDGIAGGGFDLVIVERCDVAAPEWVFPTGIGDGGHGIDVGGLLAVHESTVTGGSGVDDFSGLFGLFSPKAGAGIVGNDVHLVNSTVTGGAGLVEQYGDTLLCSIPNLCDQLSGGEGGTGIVADTLYRQGSLVMGGAGSLYTCSLTGAACALPDGEDVDVGSVTTTPFSFLSAPSPLVVGGSWNLTFFASALSPTYPLVISPQPRAPVTLFEGQLWMNPAAFLVKFIPETFTGGFTVNFAIPNDTSLAGITIVAQVLDPGSELTNPVFATAVLP